MFRCGRCGRVTVPREKGTRVVMEQARVLHPTGSWGNQIVKEMLVCQQCAGLHMEVHIVLPTVQSADIPTVLS